MASQQYSDNPYKQGGPSFDESRGFFGVDHWSNPQDMTGGYLLGADNMLNRQGVLYVRPGLAGQFGGTPASSSSASPSSSSSSAYVDVGATSWAILPGPNYGLALFTDTFGATWLLFTSGGKLYKSQQASGYRTELLDTSLASYNFSSAVAQAVVFQDYAYIVDGAHALVRVDLNGGFPAYPMQAPTTSPPASLTSTLLFQANNAGNWSFDGQSTPDGNLVAPYGQINAPGNTWTGLPTGGASEPGPYYNIISAGSGIYPGTGAAPDKIAVAHLTGNANLYPSRFHLIVPCIKDTQAGNASFNAIVTPYDASMNQLSGAFVVNIVPAASTTQLTFADVIVDMSALGPVVAFLQFELLNAISVQGGNMYVSTPQLYPITTQITFLSGATSTLAMPSISGGAVGTSSSSMSSSSSSSSSSMSPSSSSSLPGFTNVSATDLGTTLDLQGTSFIFTFPATSSSSSRSGTSSSSGAPVGGIDLSNINRLVIGVGNGQIASWQGLAVALYLQQNGPGQPWILADNGVTISADLTGLDCDISTLTAAQRTHITAIKLTFLLNVQWTSPLYGLPLGPITTPGNLSIGLADYQYYLTETADIDSLDMIESNPSLASAPLTPTFAVAEALVNLAPGMPVNTGAPANVPLSQLKYNLYRLGGALSDTRLVATVFANTSVAYGTDPTNPYYSYNAATGQFLDNTPDLWIVEANLLSFSRDPMPSNGQAIAVYNGRLAVAVGNVLDLSWLYNDSNSAALQTTLVPNPDDPYYLIAGASFPVSADASDIIVAMVPYGTPVVAGNQFGGGLAVFCKRSVYLVQGTNASNFSVQQFPYTPGVGLVSAKAVTRISPNELVFAGPDRLHVFPPSGDSPQKDVGLRIQPDLYPVSPQTLQNPSAMSGWWMSYHDGRLYLGCPQPGQGQNTVVWGCDFRMGGGWTRLTGPSTSAGLSSSSSLRSSASSSSSSMSGQNFGAFPLLGMAMTSALSCPPTQPGGDFELYYFGLDGQVYRTIGTYDQYSPSSAAQAIPFSVTVHAMRPGFYYRYKLRPLFYMWARLERIEIEMMMNGQLSIVAMALTAGGVNPVPIPGKKTVQSYLLTGFGRPFVLNVPPGLIEGQMIEVTVSGAVGLQGPGDVAYLRGLRGFISGTTYEYG